MKETISASGNDQVQSPDQSVTEVKHHSEQVETECEQQVADSPLASVENDNSFSSIPLVS